MVLKMYTTNSGIAISSLSELIEVSTAILNQYGDLPVYKKDNAIGIEEEVPVLYLNIRSTAISNDRQIKPRRILVN